MVVVDVAAAAAVVIVVVGWSSGVLALSGHGGQQVDELVGRNIEVRMLGTVRGPSWSVHTGGSE